MKTWRSLPLVIGTLALSVLGVLVMNHDDDDDGARSVGPVQTLAQVPDGEFSRAESTGLFVGVRTFRHDGTLTVPYAADDAVDLAYKFSLDQRSSLVPPRRVVLALAGRPQKEESQQRLRDLEAAGARVENATSGDIENLLDEQVRLAGTDGLFILSLATHGFLDDTGDAYILGSTSTLGSKATSLRTAALLDVAGLATRSLVFIDACRDRIGTGSRGAAPDPRTRAPMLRKMGNIQGQVIFYAAAADQWAYDDEVSQNGVFTKAVLDGLDCKAATPRGEVIAETLYTYVDREVRRWIRANRKPLDGPVTQVSMEGGTHNMPLAQCWRSPEFEIRPETDGRTIKAFDENTRPLWAKELAKNIVLAEAADLDADALQEVVVGTEDAIIVYDREGKELWRRDGEGQTLTHFTTADLFRKHTQYIVALWTGEKASRVMILDSAGDVIASYEDAEHLLYLVIDRETSRHNPRIAVASADSIFLLDPRKGAVLWQQVLRSSKEIIEKLHIGDANHDSRRDIEVTTKSGKSVFTFDGEVQEQSTDWREGGKR